MKKIKTKTLMSFLTLLALLSLNFTWLTTSKYTNPKIAPKEELLVIKNNKVIFDLLGKKGETLDILEKGIVKFPEFGDVFIFSGDSIAYKPNKDVCEVVDVFSYYIKTVGGEDTVEVSVEILCESLTILSGFSPDGDGIDDTFTILGVQNYPNNSLLIFNKWGEQVYRKKGYQNEWSGTDDDGEKLTSKDSIYYYVFQDGEGKSYSGHLQILAKT